MKIVSWNVNGLARCRRNGFLKFLADAKPDVLCCQEIKGECPLNVPGYLLFWNPAKRTNYSGTLVLSRRQPPASMGLALISLMKKDGLSRWNTRTGKAVKAVCSGERIVAFVYTDVGGLKNQSRCFPNRPCPLQ